MSYFVKKMVDSDGKESVFLFEIGNKLPVGVLEHQDITILKQSIEQCEREYASLSIPAPASKPEFERTVHFKTIRKK